ncbi:MAG: glycosyltransferase family 4 protein, partial [bacterium]|nr:glycosyltransferase family 4 protein [bacterium]
MARPDASSPRIAIDASSVVGQRTGIGRATAELLNALANEWPAEWAPAAILVNSSRLPIPSGDLWVGSPRFQVHHRHWPGRALLRAWQHLRWPPIERLVGPVELVHSPASYIPVVRAARRIITVHDLYFQYAPQHVEPFGGGYFAQTFPAGLPRMDHIIAVSRFTRDELVKFYGLSPDQITVVPQGIEATQFNPSPQPDDVARIERQGIRRPYLLCVATVEPRKNLITLVEAYARVRQILGAAGQNPPNLVITGQPGWGIKVMQQRLAEAGLGDKVIMTGYLPDDVLPPLYRQALGFVLPSVYEGFGMPVLEAMACGCPAAVSMR